MGEVPLFATTFSIEKGVFTPGGEQRGECSPRELRLWRPTSPLGPNFTPRGELML
jgi:hypothetical protein